MESRATKEKRNMGYVENRREEIGCVQNSGGVLVDYCVSKGHRVSRATNPPCASSFSGVDEDALFITD